MNCNRALMYESNIKLSILVPFLTPTEALRVGTYGEKYFFFCVSFLMASDGGGLHLNLMAIFKKKSLWHYLR